MKVLVHEKDTSVSARIDAMLRAGAYDPIVLADDGAVRAALTTNAVPFVLISARDSDESVLELLRAARRGAAKDAYITLLTQACSEEYLTAAHEAGADADLRSPFGRSLLLARLKAAERFVRREPELERELQVAVPPPDAGNLLDRITLSATWRNVSHALAEAASRFLTLPVKCSDAVSSPLPLTLASQISLSNVQSQLEIRVAVGADADSTRSLAVHMFGPESDDLAADMLGEVGNIFMGTMKTAFSAEAQPFTGGLPSPLDVDQVFRPLVTFKHQEAFSLLINGARLVVHIGVRSKANVFRLVKSLREGMVLAKDLHNPRGLMLLKGGTRLSSTMIEKLDALLTHKSQVEVTAP